MALFPMLLIFLLYRAIVITNGIFLISGCILMSDQERSLIRCYGDYTFSVAMECFWNSVKSATSLGIFKSLLNTHLLKIAFQDL